MTLEQQYEQLLNLEKNPFNPRTEVLAYSVGKKNANGAMLTEPVKSERAKKDGEHTLRRFPQKGSQYLKELGWVIYNPPAPKKAAAKKSTAKKDDE